MANFNLEDYEPVSKRIQRFYGDHLDGRITSKILFDDGRRIMVMAKVYKDAEGPVWATGIAEEVRGDGFVNKTSAPENCETSAIGRALANANYGGDLRTSREEMEHVVREEERLERERMQTSPVAVAEFFAMLKARGIETKEDAETILGHIKPEWRKLNTSGIASLRKALADTDALTLEMVLKEATNA